MKPNVLASASRLVILDQGIPLRGVVVRRIVEWEGGGTNRSVVKTNNAGICHFEPVFASRVWSMLGFKNEFRQRIVAHVDGQEIALLTVVKLNLDDGGEFGCHEISLRCDISYPFQLLKSHSGEYQLRGELLNDLDLCAAK